MLGKEENELLCRVGPGTPMGNLLRQYWFPAMPSYELPSPDCPPLISVPTAQAMPSIIDELRSRGYQLVTVSEMIGP